MVTILLALIALFGAFAFASCGGSDTDETPIAEGPETGEYYCDAQSGAEYTISLHDGNKVDFKVQSYDLNGTYSVSGRASRSPLRQSPARFRLLFATTFSPSRSARMSSVSGRRSTTLSSTCPKGHSTRRRRF